MSVSKDGALEYYAKHGLISDPGTFAGLIKNLPSDLSRLRDIVQGMLIHVFWAERYGERLADERKAEAGIRHVERMLAKIQEIQDGPVAESRDLNHRLVGNCRTYSVLLAAMLRTLGTPARARCGFGRYFIPGWYEDHWICEYWNEKSGRWIMVDAQLDEFQCRKLRISFDPLDVPRDQFIVGGKAWLSCRNGEADPDNFGIFDMHGLWFVRGNLIRDIAALNKMELLPWDGWGLIDREDKDIIDEDLVLLGKMASLTADEVKFLAVREVYESNEGLVVPPVINSYTQSGSYKIEWSTEKVVA